MRTDKTIPASVSPLNWGLLSQYRDQLFGITILLIMIFHGRIFPALVEDPILSAYLPTRSWVPAGSIGVDAFLFLSGMGLYHAMEQRPSLPAFYGRRLKRILIPYLIIGGLYWYFKDVTLSHDIPRFWEDFSLRSYFTTGLATYWYIALILPLYLLSPLFLWLFRTRFRTFFLFALYALCLGGTIYLSVVNEDSFWHMEKALDRIFIFVLGCYFGRTIQEKRPMRPGWIAFALLTLTCRGLVYYLASLCQSACLERVIIRQWYNAAGLALCILLPIALHLFHSQVMNRCFAFLGALSLELYLSHLALRNCLKMLSPDDRLWDFWSSFTVYLGILLASCLISYLLHQAQNQIETRFTHRKRRRETP